MPYDIRYAGKLCWARDPYQLSNYRHYDQLKDYRKFNRKWGKRRNIHTLPWNILKKKNDGVLFIDFAKKSFVYQSLCKAQTFIFANR